MFVVAGMPRADAQSLHRWTAIDDRGTAVDWNTLEHVAVGSSGQTLTVWARTVQEFDTLTVQVAVRCAPRHAAVVEVQRMHPNGRMETSGPIALSAVTWQDPPPLSYLATVSRAVCARTREERPRPC
jgi:hypothetical protein